MGKANNSLDNIPDSNIMETVAKLATTLSADLQKAREVLITLADRLYYSNYPVKEIEKICETASYVVCETCKDESKYPSKYLQLSGRKTCNHE